MPPAHRMNELSLFSGAGGGLLGTTLLGWEHIGYVEFNDYCQRIIKQRIIDGFLDAAPIFGDIRAFISEGFAASYTGMVDVITAGFPCQPFSVAGKRKQADDERNMWPATADVIRIVKPRFVLLENVPGVRKYLPVVIRDLRRCGYEVSHPLQLGADDVGAPHRRKRVWIMANSVSIGRGSRWPECAGQQRRAALVCSGDVADTTSGELSGKRWKQERRNGLRPDGENVADTEGITERSGLCPNKSGRIRRGRFGDGGSEGDIPNTDKFNGNGSGFYSSEISQFKASELSGRQELPDAETEGLERQDAAGGTCADGRFMQYLGRDWWATEPDVGRVAHGVASRVDRLKAIGNGQVPGVVAAAWNILIKGYKP